MAPNAVVPAARPISCPEKCNRCPSQVPSVTYQTPQMKYSRNIITDRRPLICSSTQSPLGPLIHSSLDLLERNVLGTYLCATCVRVGPFSHRSMGFLTPGGGWYGSAILRPSPADA